MRTFSILIFCLLTILHFPGRLSGASPDSDERAVTLLSQALASAGVSSSTAAERGYRAAGTITYFWGRQRVDASVAIRYRSSGEFRMDSNVPGGVRTLVTQQHSGRRKDANDKRTDIPRHNLMSGMRTTLPYPTASQAVSDPEIHLTYLGTVQEDSRTLHRVRTTRLFPSAQDPSGMLAALSQTEYFIDGASRRFVRVEDAVHPVDTLMESYPRRIELSDYAVRDGIQVPLTIRETISGVVVSELRVSSIDFSGEPAESEFALP